MRFAAYAGTSVVLAAGTIIRAFFQRANFYSASVQISQSNASLMILTNVALLGISMLMLGLQRVFYGPLRPIEVEQLYEKAWFAITETCLAMTIFREEVGARFLVMFVSLLIGKVWGWIGEGRVEILEQQPPANPRLFHAQLSLSLLISAAFDSFMLQYSVNTVLRHARPNMMVMFAFEFAVLTVTSLSTAARYGISVYESRIIKNQIKERRSQLRVEREQARSQETASAEPSGDLAATPASDDDIESMEIDTPGWEDKGRWIFYLDLATDFLKLVLYITFFCVLCMFYGMPIHIIRDVALTIRSFYKRITDFVRYRQATRDMNSRYPDATPEEITREDVCIICREDIRPWPQQATGDAQQAHTGDNPPARASPGDERSRPKKLPCGHILHFACLRSWLERQQICPTCRRPVLVPDANARAQGGQPPAPQGRQNPPGNPGQAQPQGQNAQQQNIYQFGPFRIAFGVRPGAPGPPQQLMPAGANQQAAAPGNTNTGRARSFFGRQTHQPRTAANFTQTNVPSQLQQIEQQISREVQDLGLHADQLRVVRALQGELTRLRTLDSNHLASTSNYVLPSGGINNSNHHIQPHGIPFTTGQPLQSGAAHSSQLPPGLTLPEGWTLLPLRQISSGPGLNSAQNSDPNSQASALNSFIPTDVPLSSAERPQGAVSGLVSQSPGLAAPSNNPNPPFSTNDSNRTTAAAAAPTASSSADPRTQDTLSEQIRPPRENSSSATQWGFEGLDSVSTAESIQEPSQGSEQGKATTQEGGQQGEEDLSIERDRKGKGRAVTVEDGTEDLD